MMEQRHVKYEKMVEILKRTKPVLGSTDEIETIVIKRISGTRKPAENHSDLIDFLFGWIYINWVRRSLVTASVFLVIVFIFQQSFIMSQINRLSRQIELCERDASGVADRKLSRKMLLIRYSEKSFPFSKMSSSDNEVEELFQTIDELKKEYKELQNMIEEDPELEKLIEKKLSEIDREKVKL